MGELILTYSELLEDAKDRNKAANIIYKLIMLSENKTFSDVQVVTGTALFFNKIGKYQSGVNIIKNYLRAKGKTSTKLLSYYLDLLIKAGELSDASKLALKINDIPNKPYESYISLAEYFESDEKQELASKVIAEGLEKYPNSVALILKQADYYLNTKSLEKYEALLLKSKKLNLELSPSYTAKFYKHMGFLAAAKNKNKEASIFFKKSLAIIESEDLRSVLSTLDIKGDKFAQALILESKIIELMKKAEIEIKNLNYETASALSVEAVDADPGYVPAMLQHVRIQLVKGLYDAAIFSLNRLLEKNSNNMQIQTMLIETNIKSYKFDDAQKSLVELSKTKFAFTAEYASLMAYLFEEKKVHHLAIEWYLKALSINPLSDRDLYNLSKICFKLKKFEDAKKYLNKAITLDPKNVEYISLQAQILADQDNADIALGYLRDSISELGESPLLISTIAKIYYSSGQIKEFQSYYKKILAMPKKDENFFEFLIYAAKLEENKVDFTNYAKELLKINPGNLSLQMELAEFYMKEGDLGEARERLNQVNDRLKSYPRLHYLLSKIALRQGDLEKAKAMAEQEKVLNPTLEYSNIMLGEIALAKKDYHESLSQYEQALSLNPKSVEALVAMGKIQLLQNHGREAIDLLLMARRNDKLNPEISKQLGYAYKAAGQRADAKTYFDSYIQLNPGALDRAQIEALIRTLK